jgi:uncharacterized protein (TIGR03663 family)
MIIRLLPLVILLLLRFYDLGIRPPHHDEAVNGWFVDGLFNRGYYVYDPQNYHGPLFFYLLALFVKVFGRSVESLRDVTVIFASLISFTPFLFRKWLGRTGTWIAAIIFTISPAMIFYSRYAIHETLFALACILFFYVWLRIKEVGFTTKTIFGFALSFAAMATLKENFVLFGAALFLGEGVLYALTRKVPFQFTRQFWLKLLTAIAISAVLIAVVYSGGFREQNGIPNFFKAFGLWFQTGEKGNGHEKPFTYWLEIMGQYEWFSFLGLCLVPFFLSKKVPKEVRLSGLTCSFLWLIYSLVAYKTPWCMLSFYWGLIFVTAYVFGDMIDGLKGAKKAFIWVPFLCGCLFSLTQAYDAAYENPDQDGHRYIYGQTFRDMMVPINEILDRAKANPELKKTMKIQVVSSFTWPLPYLLGEFKQVGYYGEKNAPETLDADEIIMDKAFEAKMNPRIKGNYSRTEVRSRQWASPLVFLRKNGG